MLLVLAQAVVLDSGDFAEPGEKLRDSVIVEVRDEFFRFFFVDFGDFVHISDHVLLKVLNYQLRDSVLCLDFFRLVKQLLQVPQKPENSCAQRLIADFEIEVHAHLELAAHRMNIGVHVQKWGQLCGLYQLGNQRVEGQDHIFGSEIFLVELI